MTRLATLTFSTLAALGIAFAPAPAAADSDDIAKIIAGLAIAGIVAKAIDNRNDRRATVQTRSRSPRFNSIEDGNGIVGGTLRRPGKQRQNNRRWSYKNSPLPDQCQRILNTSRGDRTVYARRCLRNNYQFTNKLPSNCQLQVRTNRGLRTVYGSRCLARDGWQVARR